MRRLTDLAVLAASLLGADIARAQDGEPMRTPHGDPDISGIFTYRTLTPFQRPEQFSEQETLDAEAAAAFEASERTRLNRDLFDPERGARSAGYAPRAEGGVLSYNEFWYERGVDLTDDKRTSLVIDPPNGRLPPRVPRPSHSQMPQLTRQERINRSYESYENRSLFARCIMGFNSGPPMTSSTYNSNVMIVQPPEHVAILTEMVHDVRIVPIDRGAEKPPFKQFSGVSRGHWEGETFVVETTNFRGGESRGTSPNKHLVEKFTRINQDRIAYEFTVTDPTVYTAPYTVLMPFRRTDGPIFEYACHEGNIGMHGILAGARNLEAEGRELRP